MLNAENAYLFRHALLRDAAYQLQPTSERRVLHRLSFELVCQLLDVDTGSPVSEDTARRVGAAWAELALHAELAVEGSSDPLHEFARKCVYQAARHDSRSYRNRAAIAGFRRVAEHPLTPVDEQVTIWLRLGDLERTMGNMRGAAAACLRMQELAEQGGRKELVAHALALRGYTLGNMGEWATAEALMQEGVKLAREAGSQLILGKALQLQALVSVKSGGGEESIAALRESIEIARSQNATELLAESTRDLGTQLVRSAQVQEGEALLREAAETFRNLAESRQVVACEVGLAIAAAVTGRNELAVEMFTAARDEYFRFGAVRMAAGMLRYMATGLIALKQYERARDALKQSKAILQDLDDLPGVMNADFSLGTLALDEGNFEEAERLFRPLIELSVRAGDNSMAAISRSHLAEALVHLGGAEEAVGLAQTAIQTLKAAKNQRQWAYAQYALAVSLRLTAQGSEADAAGADAVALAHESGDPVLIEYITSRLEA